MERALAAMVAAINMAVHHSHILQMAFAAFVTHRAIVRVIHHQPFRNAGAKLSRLGIINGNPNPVFGGSHARHDNLAALVFLILELLDCALAARAY